MSVDEATRAQAEELKTKGNAAYRSRDFAAAVAAYDEAFTVVPDPVYLNNKATALYEAGDYDQSISVSEKAVDEGREQRADYKVIAKSFARIGAAHTKKGDYDLAIKNLEKSLTEHRTPDTLAKLKEAQKAKSEAERLAYLSPELADKAREEGNTAFKSGDFATSVKHYTDSIKRNPSDPRAYTNRAAAYSKLLALPEALKDSDAAIAADPKFIKGYIRKSITLLAMRESKRALDAIQLAAEKDEKEGGGKNKREIQAQMQKCIAAEYGDRENETDEQKLQRAMRDPEVQQIMSDPVMQSILQQAQEDPKALQSHMTNPMIRQKIMKLVESGIIGMGPRR